MSRFTRASRLVLTWSDFLFFFTHDFFFTRFIHFYSLWIYFHVIRFFSRLIFVTFCSSTWFIHLFHVRVFTHDPDSFREPPPPCVIYIHMIHFFFLMTRLYLFNDLFFFSLHVIPPPTFFHDLLTRTVLFHVLSRIVLDVVAVYSSSRARSGRDVSKCAFGRPRHVIARVRSRVNVESRVRRTAAAPRGRPHASQRSVLFSTSVRASISLLTLSVCPPRTCLPFGPM